MKKAISICVIVILVLSVVVLSTACGDKETPEGERSKQEQSAQESGAENGEKDETLEGEKTAESSESEEKTESSEGEGKAPSAEDGSKGGANKEEVKVNTDIITINTQSSIRIAGTKTVYIDPYKITEAPHDADVILITHAHYDHFDRPSLKNVAGKSTFVVCPDSMAEEVSALGIDTKGFAAMEAGAAIEPKAGLDSIVIEAVPAYNMNKNFHPKANGWLGYVLEMDGVKYYAAGDTDALPELEKVKCDVAMVPVGGTYTMTAPEAAGLVNKIKPVYAIPIHYGTIVGRASDADVFGDALSKDITLVKKVEDAK